MCNNRFTKIETETIILYNRAEDFVEISTRIKKDKTKLNRFGYQPVIDDDGYMSFKIPESEFTWGKKKKLSDKQIKRASDWMTKYNKSKNKKKKDDK